METKSMLQAGFARVDITPALGTPMAGYYDPHNRLSLSVRDPLEANVLAISCEEKTVLLFSLDLLCILKTDADNIRRQVEEKTGVPYEAIFLACTHTHTGPHIWTNAKALVGERRALVERYMVFLADRCCDAAIMALADRKRAKMGHAVATLPGVARIRRYYMKDGSIRTNPAKFDPNIIGPVGDVDERVNVLRFVREGGKEIAVANFGIHPCGCSGIDEFSADVPRFVRETVEAVLPAHCIYFTGAQGDVNALNPFAKPKNEDPFVQANDLADSGYNFTAKHSAKHMGRAIAGTLLQVYGDVKWSEDTTVCFAEKNCNAFVNKPEPEEIPWAEEFHARRAAGEDVKQTYPPHSLARANRILAQKDAPETRDLPVMAVRVGPVAFVGVPGEPFTQIGVRLKANSPFEMTLPCCCTNDYQGYYPMQEDYSGQSYEAVSSQFKAGTAEALVETGTELLQKLNED